MDKYRFKLLAAVLGASFVASFAVYADASFSRAWALNQKEKSSSAVSVAASSNGKGKGEVKDNGHSLRQSVRDMAQEGKVSEAIDYLEAKLKEKLLSPEEEYLIPASLSVLYLGKKTLIYSLPEAKKAVKAKPGDANLRTNLGILYQRNGERSQAVEQYRKAISLNAGDWRPHLGIAQCLSVDGVDGRVIAEKELKQACSVGHDSREKWFLLGSAYLTLRMYKEAVDAFASALKSNAIAQKSDQQVNTLYLKALLFNKDQSKLKELFPVVVGPAFADHELAVLLMAQSELPPADREKLLSACALNFVGADQTFYQLGRVLEQQKQFDLARKAYEEAMKTAPQSSCYKLALVGNRLLAADEAAAREYLTRFNGQVVSALPEKKERIYRDAFAQALKMSSQILDEKGETPYHIMKAVYHRINCGCRISVIEFKLRMLNGVIFANLLDMKEPPLTVVYDTRALKPETIVQTAKREDDVFEVLADDPIKSLPQLIHLVQKAADKQDKHIFYIWSFEPPPMELP